MSETNKKEYDLEMRVKTFAIDVRDFCMQLKKDVINIVYIKQVIRSSSSIGANYIEANDNLGEKDLIMRIRISRKEAKETKFWMELLLTETADLEMKRKLLHDEANQIMLIFGSILKKLTAKLQKT